MDAYQRSMFLTKASTNNIHAQLLRKINISRGNVLISEHLHQSVNDLWCWFDVEFGSRLWPRVHIQCAPRGRVNICQNLSQRVIAPSLTWCNERGCACIRVERGKTCVKLYHAKRKSRQSKTLSYLSSKFSDNKRLFIHLHFLR